MTQTTTESKMVYRRFGRTELQMPVLSCGGMRYQDGWQDKPLEQIADESQKNVEACVHRALELGINHIETARGYGPSERQLGQVLPQLPRDQIIVQTKIGPKDDPDAFIADFEDSMQRLNLDYVDLLAIHGVNDYRTLWQAVRRGGCLGAAREIQKRGQARHIGFSTHGPCDVICAAINEQGDGGFDYVNLHWYYIFQNNWPAIEQATRRDMGVFIISPSDKGGKLYQPPQKLVDLCQPLSPIVFNDLFCLDHAQVHTLSIGAAQPDDFDEHVKTLDVMDQADQLLPQIDQRLQAAMHQALGDEAELHLDKLPSWDATPGFVNVPIILWLRKLALGWDMLDYAKMRYNLLGNGGHWFAGGNAAFVPQSKLAGKLANHPLGGERIVEMLHEAHDMLAGEERKRLSQGG